MKTKKPKGVRITVYSKGEESQTTTVYDSTVKDVMDAIKRAIKK